MLRNKNAEIIKINFITEKIKLECKKVDLNSKIVECIIEFLKFLKILIIAFIIILIIMNPSIMKEILKFIIIYKTV